MLPYDDRPPCGHPFDMHFPDHLAKMVLEHPRWETDRIKQELIGLGYPSEYVDRHSRSVVEAWTYGQALRSA
jgi:hypothetical protein